MTFSCLHMYYSLVYQITQGATSYTHVLKVHVQTETQLMMGIAFFPVLAAWLKQKGSEGLGTRLHWVYDSVAVFLPVVIDLRLCVWKRLCHSGSWGGRGIFFVVFVVFLVCEHQRLCFLIHMCTIVASFVHCCAAGFKAASLYPGLGSR